MRLLHTMLALACMGTVAFPASSQITINPPQSPDLDFSKLDANKGKIEFTPTATGTSGAEKWDIEVLQVSQDGTEVPVPLVDLGVRFDKDSGKIIWMPLDHSSLDLCGKNWKVLATVEDGGQTVRRKWDVKFKNCSQAHTAQTLQQTTSPVWIHKQFARKGKPFSMKLRVPKSFQARLDRNPGLELEWNLEKAPSGLANPKPSVTTMSNKRDGQFAWPNAEYPPAVTDREFIASVQLKKNGQPSKNKRYISWEIETQDYFDMRSVLGDPADPSSYGRRPDGTVQKTTRNLDVTKKSIQALNLGAYIVGDAPFAYLYNIDHPNAPTIGEIVLGSPSLSFPGAKALIDNAPAGITEPSKLTALKVAFGKLESELEKDANAGFRAAHYARLFCEDWRNWNGEKPTDALVKILADIDAAGLALPFLHQTDSQRKIAKNLFRNTLFFNDVSNGGLGDITETQALSVSLKDLKVTPEQVDLFRVAKQAGIFQFPLKKPSLTPFADKAEMMQPPEQCPDGQKCTDKCCKYFPELSEWWCEIVENSGYFCANDSGQCTLGSDFCPAQ